MKRFIVIEMIIDDLWRLLAPSDTFGLRVTHSLFSFFLFVFLKSHLSRFHCLFVCLSKFVDIVDLWCRIPADSLAYGGVVLLSEAERLDDRARRSAILGRLRR